MKRYDCFIAWAACVSLSSSIVLGGQVIGQLSDPNQPAIDGFADITSAWVEKNGGTLTFMMELREAVPEPMDLFDPNAQLTYIWFVDADNNPNTGQSPGGVGSEFNVRVVVSSGPHAGGFVDVVGALPGGGTGSVQVSGNCVEMTIDETQIASPGYFHWRSDAAYWVPNYIVFANGITAETGVAYIDPYGVMYQATPRAYSAEVSYSASQCQPGSEDPQLADEVMNHSDNTYSGTDPVFCSIDGKYPPGTYQVLAHATGQTGFMHVRNFVRLQIDSASPKIFGQSDVTSFFDTAFMLYGPQSAGPIPPDMFRFVFVHDYHLFSNDVESQSTGNSYCQVVITQLEPLTQKGLWTHHPDMRNDEIFDEYEVMIDAADYGLEYGVVYTIAGLLSDHAWSLEPTSDAESIADSTLTMTIEVMPLPGDVDQDADVDLADFVRMAEFWLMSR